MHQLEPDDINTEQKVRLILVLAEDGYPPVERDEVYQEIFEQAGDFKKYHAATNGLMICLQIHTLGHRK